MGLIFDTFSTSAASEREEQPKPAKTSINSEELHPGAHKARGAGGMGNNESFEDKVARMSGVSSLGLWNKPAATNAQSKKQKEKIDPSQYEVKTDFNKEKVDPYASGVDPSIYEDSFVTSLFRN